MNKTETLPFMKGFNQAKNFLVKLKQSKIRAIQRQQLQNMSPILKSKHQNGSTIIQEDVELQIANSPEIERIEKGLKKIVQNSKSKSNSRYLKPTTEDQIQIIKPKLISQRAQKQRAINDLGKQLQNLNNQIIHYDCIFQKLAGVYEANRQIVRQNERLRKQQVFIDCQIMKWQKNIQEKKQELRQLKERHQKFKKHLKQQVKSYIRNSFAQQIYHSQRNILFSEYFQHRQQKFKDYSISIKRYHSQHKQTKKLNYKDSLDSQNAQQSDSEKELYSLNLKFNVMRGQNASKGSLKQIPLAKKLFKDISIDEEGTAPYQQW